ncbi:hypothetical protein [Streptomyces sp. NPDC051183]|uniref:hypothetical protein n=1 Tax=Streptomyces sp. NPDC051183 TaxID=3155165 RepID=UPI003420A377
MSHGLSPSGIRILMNHDDGVVEGHGAAIDRLVASKLVQRDPGGVKTLTADGWALYAELTREGPD